MLDPNRIEIVFTFLLGVLLFVVPRRQAVIPFMFGAIFMPIGQPILLGSLNFYPFRILILFAWLRLLIRGEFRLASFERIDKYVVLWVAVSTTVYTLLWQSFAAFQNGLGLAFNAFGSYFFFRATIREEQDAKRVVRVLGSIAILVAMCVLVERTTGRNLFYVLGGVNEFTTVREGALRCQGPFGHAILAGTFGATLFPVVLSLWQQPGGKKWAVLSTVACVVIVMNSYSSGPVLTLVAAITAMLLWSMRFQMRFIRRGVAITLIMLHLVMKAPVWALVARVSVFGSSSADHRYRLIDGFIQNFSEWWLVGTKTYGEWGWVLSDVSNNYVRIGVDGGLISLILLVCLVVVCFKGIGRALRTKEALSTRKSVWALGAALFAHLVAFMGVNYWDQMIVVWYLLLAMIASMVAIIRTRVVTAQASAA